MGTTPNPNWSVRRLQKEHDAQALKKALELNSQEPWAPSYTFEHAGYRFERLISDMDIASEGIGQRHCIASYRDTARSHEVIIFKVTGKERATLAFNVNGYFELKGWANSRPSAELERFSKLAETEFLNGKYNSN